MNYVELSKIISFALRHAPQEYNLILDKEGWADINNLILSIKKRHEEFKELNYADVVNMIAANKKKRHELNGGRIRALYGHSVNTLIKKECVVPPEFLYHGTSPANFEIVKVEGLIKMNRQYVHLTSNIKQAIQVAKRKTQYPILLQIKSKHAYLNGVRFYREGEVWMCDFVPHIFIVPVSN